MRCHEHSRAHPAYFLLCLELFLILLFRRLFFPQLSDYDSSYAQQRVDVNSYNTKQAAVQDALQQKQQQQGYQQQQAGQGGGYEGYGGDGYNYASAGTSCGVVTGSA
jgi:hypothetical protein